jgi:transcriptional regulator with XRE-family HTH domain
VALHRHKHTNIWPNKLYFLTTDFNFSHTSQSPRAKAAQYGEGLASQRQIELRLGGKMCFVLHGAPEEGVMRIRYWPWVTGHSLLAALLAIMQINSAPPHSLGPHTITAQQLLPGWIRRRRKTLDLTQAELAQRLACSVSTIQKVEEGERRPSKHLAASLLHALEIPENVQAVFMRLARGKLATRNAAMPAGAAAPNAPSPNNTPFPTNALFGRNAETEWVSNLLMGDDARLITLTGLPGVGKTRLTQHIVHLEQFLARFEDGVCYVPLSDVLPQAAAAIMGASLASAIAKSLARFGGLGDVPAPEQPDSLIAHLRERHFLLVLDDFSHLISARQLLVRLLQETRWVKLLITSCERLHLHAEHVVQLAGLPVDDCPKDDSQEEPPALQLFFGSRQPCGRASLCPKARPPKNTAHLSFGRWLAAGHRDGERDDGNT